MPARKRAWLYVIRNTKRTALLFLLFTALMTLALLGTAMYRASGETIRALRSSIGGYIVIQTAAEGEENTDEALLQQVRTLDNVRTYNGVDNYYLYTGGLELIAGSYRGSGLPGEFVPKFVGCTDSSLHERFVGASFLLEEGRHITAEDRHKAMISKELAQLNGLAVGDTIRGTVVDGMIGWQPGYNDVLIDFEIVGIYQIARSEPSSPQTPESELQENMIFTDIATAKELYQIKFPDRTAEQYNYTAGIFLFLNDPALMAQTAENLRAQPFANWEDFIITENDTRYQSAAAPIEKMTELCFYLLITLVVLSIVLLALILVMWTRERTVEIGILISLGIPKRRIAAQLVLENYYVGLPAFAVSTLLSMAASEGVGRLAGGMLAEMQLSHYIGPALLLSTLACAAVVILAAVLMASIPVMQKKPRDIWSDLS